MLTAWVLIVSLGFKDGYAIPGIASEQACRDLYKKIEATYTMLGPSMYCFPYQAAR